MDIVEAIPDVVRREALDGEDISLVRPKPPVIRRGGGIGFGGNDDGKAGPGASSLPLSTAKVGLWVFLGVVSVLFSIFVTAYKLRMGLGDWKPLSEPRLLWFNTGLLVLSSLSMQWSRISLRRGQINSLRAGLFVAGILAWAFLAGQLFVWQQLNTSGNLVSTNPANSFFYLLTALHGIHLLGGLAVGGWTYFKLQHGYELTAVQSSVELCTTYWHFLLILWCILFGLMLYT